MPLALLVFGAIFVVAGFRGTESQLITLVKGDFTGPHNFIYFVIAIWVLGAIGYIPKLRPVSDAALLLVIVVIFLSNKGFFAQFQNAIGTTQTASTTGGGQSFPLSTPQGLAQTGPLFNF